MIMPPLAGCNAWERHVARAGQTGIEGILTPGPRAHNPENRSFFTPCCLSLCHTYRIRGRPTFPLLVDAVSCLFNGEKPEVTWITQHASLPVPSTLGSDPHGGLYQLHGYMPILDCRESVWYDTNMKMAGVKLTLLTEAYTWGAGWSLSP